MEMLVLYVAMCVGMTTRDCTHPDDFDPMTWESSTVKEQAMDLDECSNLANAYATMRNVVEVDCYPVKEAQ